MQKQFKAIAVFVITSVLTSISYASDSLENNLLSTLKLKLNEFGDIERNGNHGKAIRAYMNKGYIDKKPTVYRADYVDYYVLKKPAYVLGHELKVIEEEYMSEYVGCCVNEGVGVVLKLTGSMQKLENFAQKNKCVVEPIDYDYYYESLGIVNAIPEKGVFVEMSCRANDIQGF